MLNMYVQGNPYWQMMNTHSYKYGFSGSASNSNHSLSNGYDMNDFALRFDGGGRLWDSSSVSNIEESPTLVSHGGIIGAESGASTGFEDCKSDSCSI